ncbi:uncharacterized protein A4U43_C01F26230 [Asparagus officinalis]|uniref:Uncharacterized protein n=1 Tax=Asparagus officinalis TaxID=4686 RepID=A0A5P1FS85_ASPOF|nr:uncharacterized protein A4U43_C01F26230 [Asparagus officinalis]
MCPPPARLPPALVTAAAAPPVGRRPTAPATHARAPPPVRPAGAAVRGRRRLPPVGGRSHRSVRAVRALRRCRRLPRRLSDYRCISWSSGRHRSGPAAWRRPPAPCRRPRQGAYVAYRSPHRRASGPPRTAPVAAPA